MKHSIFSPSSMHRWAFCAGSLNCDAQTDSSNIFARRGHFIHEFVQTYFTDINESFDTIISDNILKKRIRKLLRDKYSGKFDNDKNLTNDLFKAISLYYQYFNGAFTQLGKSDNSILLLEKHIVISTILDNHFGTADIVGLHNKTLYIGDLKTGFVQISPVNNLQLSSYAYGVYREFVDEGHKIESVKLSILSVSSNDILTLTLSVTEMTDMFNYIEYLLKGVATQISSKNVKHIPGDYCTYCPNKMKCCSKLSNFHMLKLDKPIEDFTQEEKELFLLDYMNYKDIYSGFYDEIYGQSVIKKDYNPKHFAVKIKYGHNCWSKEAENILSKHTNKKLLFERKYNKKLIAISKARAFLTDSELEALTVKSETLILDPIKNV